METRQASFWDNLFEDWKPVEIGTVSLTRLCQWTPLVIKDIDGNTMIHRLGHESGNLMGPSEINHTCWTITKLVAVHDCSCVKSFRKHKRQIFFPMTIPLSKEPMGRLKTEVRKSSYGGGSDAWNVAPVRFGQKIKLFALFFINKKEPAPFRVDEEHYRRNS